MGRAAMIEFDNLTLGYDRHPAVHHLTASIGKGSLLAIVGPNGAGKSTLLKGIVGQLTPLSGTIKLGTLSCHDIAYLPQQAQLDRGFPITVYELVAMGLWRRTGAFKSMRATQHQKVGTALKRLGLEGFEFRMIGTLSGGQLQRALFARLMVQDADLVILDEPFTGIDKQTTDYLVHLIEHWHQDGKTIIAVLHDLVQVQQHFPQALLLSRKLVACGATRDVLTDENLNRARQFNEAFDERASYCGHE